MSDESTTRRSLLRAGAGAAAGAAATGTAAAQEGESEGEIDYGGWFDDVGNFEGTEDLRGESSVTVEVGAQGNGGPYAFSPPAIHVDPGTEVTFEWVSDTHNVTVEDQPDGADWGGHTNIENSGFSFTTTFETEGVYEYFCQPHVSFGMKGAVAVGEVPRKSHGGSLVLTNGLLGLLGAVAVGVLSPLVFAFALWRFYDESPPSEGEVHGEP
ncbi:MAG: halocyanin domain-containing protein [Halobacteriaceae archaeon]